MRLLLLGATGQVGRALCRSLSPLGTVVAPPRTSLDAGAVDLDKPEAVGRAVISQAPDAIINAAAYTDVDGAEADAARAWRVNAEAPAALARTASHLGVPLIHYSTDYVYDGGGEAPWREDDAAAPLNVYGTTKLAGDRAVQESGCSGVILRAAWVYSTTGPSFVRAIAARALEGRALRVVDDQWGAPTPADLIADVTAHCLRTLLARPAPARVAHLAAKGWASRVQVARRIVETAAGLGHLPAQAAAIEAVPTSAFPAPARRPLNSRLDCTELETRFGLSLPEWDKELDRYMPAVLASVLQGGAGL